MSDERRGREAAESGLRPERMPDAVAERIRRSLAPRRVARIAGAAALLAAALLLFAFFASRPHVDLRFDASPLTRFESLARAAHAAPNESLDFRSAEAPAVRRFVRETTGLDAGITVDERPKEDAGRFAVVGAARLDGGAAAAIALRVDSEPVTLVVAPEDAVPDAPRWGLFAGKRVVAKSEGGMHFLTWRNSGQAYTLVSRLGRHGERSCLVCHTDPARRALVEGLAAR